MRTTAIILGALGDFLLTLPLLRALHREGPVGFITRGSYRALLPTSLASSSIVDLDGSEAAALFGASGRLSGRLLDVVSGSVVQAFMRPDEGISSHLVDRGDAVRVVWHDPRPVAPPHIVERFFRQAGLPCGADVLDQPVMSRAAAGAADALWLHAGSGSSAKTLCPDRLADLAEWHGRALGHRIIVSFGEADLDLLDPIRNAFGCRELAFSEVICPSLGDLRAQLTRDAAAYMGADTGVTHLAAALGIPCTAFFRSTDPRIWRPVGFVKAIVEST